MINPTERTGNLVITAVLLGIGMFSVIASRLMPSGQFGEMGPGFFPGLLGGILVAISLLLGGQVLLNRSLINRVDFMHRNSWAIVGATILVAMLLKDLGFIPAIGLFIFFNLKLLSNMGWVRCILVSAAAAIGVYVFFDSLLGIPLPAGDWL
jgi:putative tricarboxylic transport membrane protein